MTIPSDEAVIQAARDMYCSDDLEIDDEPKLSPAVNGTGTWVAAWVWVDHRDVEGLADTH